MCPVYNLSIKRHIMKNQRKIIQVMIKKVFLLIIFLYYYLVCSLWLLVASLLGTQLCC